MSMDKTQKEFKFELDHASGLPLHYQVEQLLREIIQDPVYQEGKLLPKEVDLADRKSTRLNSSHQ